MDRSYAAHTSLTAPTLPASPATGYPQGGDIGVSPTQAGPYWFHMITESLRNVIVAAELDPDASDLTLLAQAIQALATSAASSGLPVGFVGYHRRSSAPAGWVEMRDGTIGNAASGGTARAHADTAALFALIWDESDNAAAPIQDSAGAASVRGASAAADFAAGKRLPLDDMRAEFLRGLDTGRGVDAGRVLGSAQAGQNASHTHTATVAEASLVGGAGGIAYASTGSESGMIWESDVRHSHGITIDNSGGSEARPRNRAYLACIKL
jgi:hypothetical protein